MRFTLLAASLAVSFPVAAAAPADQAKSDPAAPQLSVLPAYITDSSYTEHNGHRVVQFAMRTPAKVEDLYALFTSPEGFKKWGAAWAVQDFSMGGYVEGSFAADTREGDPRNVRNQTITYLRNKVIVQRGLASGTHLIHQDLYRTMTILLVFDDMGKQGSLMTATIGPFQQGERWDELYAHTRRTYPGGLDAIYKALTAAKPAK